MQTGQSFLLTPLREGRRGKGALIASFSQFLLTPLREGRLLPGGRIPGVDHISTHAPAGGATFEQLDNRDTFQLISTHAPAGGATPYSMRLHVIEAHFYSRPCGRGDKTGCCHEIKPASISTHAPAGGATGTSRAEPPEVGNFYSRPCGRGDERPQEINDRQTFDFYSRPCGRGDVAEKHSPPSAEHFYSRPCGRGDHTWAIGSKAAILFLLTPLREGRR